MSTRMLTIRIEVKTGRDVDGTFKINSRDLIGIRVDRESDRDCGYLAVVLDEDLVKGPQLGFIDEAHLVDGTQHKSELRRIIERGKLFERLNKRWGDWLLEPDAIEQISDSKHSNILSNMRHFLDVRNLRDLPDRPLLELRDEQLRRRLQRDIRVNICTSPQQEGFLHQSILVWILENDEHIATSFVLNNPIGVPDIIAGIDIYQSELNLD